MPEQPLALDQVNAEIVRELLRDLVIECSSNTQVVIKQDSRAGADDGQAILQAASDLTVDITNVGVKNGLDTGSEASDTWYYIWMIYNPGTQETAGLLSASATAPTLPSGFTKKRLVGAVRNDGSNDFLGFQQCDDRVNFAMERSLLSGGSSGTFVPLSLTNLIPTIVSNRVDLETRILVTGGGGGQALLSIDGVNINRQPDLYCALLSGSARVYTFIDDYVTRNDQLYYKVGNATYDQLNLWVVGFTLNL